MPRRAPSGSQASAAGAAKRARVRTPEEAVAQCLRDNFRGWPAELIDLKRVGGKTLRETLLADKAQQVALAKPMGGPYYETHGRPKLMGRGASSLGSN